MRRAAVGVGCPGAGTLKVGKDPITIELVEEPDSLPLVSVTWPSTGLSVSARKFGDVAAAITRVFANASIELARIKGRRL
jgi:hypothetical protein